MKIDKWSQVAMRSENTENDNCRVAPNLELVIKIDNRQTSILFWTLNMASIHQKEILLYLIY